MAEVLSVRYKKFTSQQLLRIPYLWDGVVSTELKCINKWSETSGFGVSAVSTDSGRYYAYNVTCLQVDYHCC